MTVFLRKMSDFSIVAHADPISYDVPIFSSDGETGRFVFVERNIFTPDRVGDWLESGGRLWVITSINPSEKTITVTVGDAFSAFNRTHIFASGYETCGEFLAAMFNLNYKQQSDDEYSMPYLSVSNSDATPLIVPDLSYDILYKAEDYLRYLSLRGVKIDFSVGSGVLGIAISTRPAAEQKIFFGDGHASYISSELACGTVAKVTAVVNGVNNHFYLQSDGSFSTSPPSPRIEGTWTTLVCTQSKMSDAVTAAFSKDKEGTKIEFYSDREYEFGKPLDIWLDRASRKTEVTGISISSKDSRYRYKAGTRAATLIENLRMIAYRTSSGGTGGGISSETDPIFSASAAHGISAADIQSWNNKSDFSGAYADLTGKPTIPDELADLTEDATHRTVTDAEKAAWNMATGTAAVRYDTDQQLSDAQKMTARTNVGVRGHQTYYGTSSTASGITTKTVAVSYPFDGYIFFDGVAGTRLSVKFTYAHSGETTSLLLSGVPTSEAIRLKSVVSSNAGGSVVWDAGETVEFVYNGSDWVLMRQEEGAEQVNADWNATSGKAQILNKPTIPAAVTESTVSGWGFTKNSGTYSKPSTGIPKTDLASDVQTSLGKADTALQTHQDISGKLSTSGNGSSVTALFSTPSTRANIASGETLAVMFGKIRKYFSDLGTLAFKSTAAKSDLASDVQTSLGKADTALQSFTETDPVFSASPAHGITAENISAWNAASAAATSFFGTCTTAAGTQTKVVSSTAPTNLALAAGVGVSITFTNAQSYSGQSYLNVCNTGAKRIDTSGMSVNYKWSAGETLDFVYNGSNWLLLNAKPSVPTVNDGTLTFRQGGQTVGTFTANDADNLTIDIPETGGEPFRVTFTETLVNYNPTYTADKTLLEISNALRNNQDVYGIIHRGTSADWQEERVEVYRYDYSDNDGYVEFVTQYRTSTTSEIYRTHLSFTTSGITSEIEWSGLSPTEKTSLMTQAVGVDSDGRLWTSPIGSSGVSSVNGETGVVVLDADDIDTEIDKPPDTHIVSITGYFDSPNDETVSISIDGESTTAAGLVTALTDGSAVSVSVTVNGDYVELDEDSPIKFKIVSGKAYIGFVIYRQRGAVYWLYECSYVGSAFVATTEGDDTWPQGYQSLPTGTTGKYSVGEMLKHDMIISMATNGGTTDVEIEAGSIAAVLAKIQHDANYAPRVLFKAIYMTSAGPTFHTSLVNPTVWAGNAYNTARLLLSEPFRSLDGRNLLFTAVITAGSGGSADSGYGVVENL